VIDHDTVGVSNLHRQILHTTERVGMNKAASAALAIKRFVPSLQRNMSLQTA
jgi:adenylyltransferase/sulfurtransferase